MSPSLPRRPATHRLLARQPHHLQAQQVQPRGVVGRAPQQVKQLVGKARPLVRRRRPGVERKKGAQRSGVAPPAPARHAAVLLLLLLLSLPELLGLQLAVQRIQLGPQEGDKRLQGERECKQGLFESGAPKLRAV